jgi:hypothetical protein
MTTMGQGQLAPCPHQRKTRRIQPPAPPALHKGIRAALGHFDQYGREAGRGSRYFDSWCHRLIWSWSLLKLRIENYGAVPRSQVARSSRHLSWIEVWSVGASQGVRKRASSRAGARRRLLIAINKGGSTCGESPVRNPPRQHRARGAHQSQRSGMRRTPLPGDGTRARSASPSASPVGIRK